MAKQAILPEGFESDTIGTMMTGETRYTLPWAMWADANRALWLHPGYPAEIRPGGTAEMRVELQEDGYHVWPRGGYRYVCNAEPPFTGSAEYLPVAEIH